MGRGIARRIRPVHFCRVIACIGSQSSIFAIESCHRKSASTPQNLPANCAADCR
jgi:hypothetical protein